MDAKQKNLIKNIAGGIAFLLILILVLIYLGVFEGEESDEAQIRNLMDRAKEEINDDDFDDLFRLGNMTNDRREAWKNNLPKQAPFVVIDDIRPMELISVPAGAMEYELDVKVIAHVEVFPGRNNYRDVVDGTLYFVKKDGRWWIDFDRSADTLQYVSKP